MSELAVTAFALGLAGVDPAGLVIALGALAGGARERSVIGFALVVVVGTALLGTVLTLTVGQRLQRVDWSALTPPTWLGAAVELALAAGLLVWAVLRVAQSDVRPPRPRRRAVSGVALLWAGVLFAMSAALDPTFGGLVVVAGREESVGVVASAHLVWIITSQAPLVVLTIAVLLRTHVSALAWLEDRVSRARPALAKVGTGALGVVGIVLLTDVVWWFTTGRFLLPDPA